jgi:hypothetical protein
MKERTTRKSLDKPYQVFYRLSNQDCYCIGHIVIYDSDIAQGGDGLLHIEGQ